MIGRGVEIEGPFVQDSLCKASTLSSTMRNKKNKRETPQHRPVEGTLYTKPQDENMNWKVHACMTTLPVSLRSTPTGKASFVFEAFAR